MGPCLMLQPWACQQPGQPGSLSWLKHRMTGTVRGIRSSDLGRASWSPHTGLALNPER